MDTSRIPDVIDALTALWTTALADQADVKVLDGPPVTGDPLHEAIYVGYDGDPDGDGDAATTDQAWAGLGARARDETLTVTCAVIVWKGGTAVRPVRVRAFELLAEAEDALRADPSLGLPPPTVVALVSGSLAQAQRRSGIECRIGFQVAVQTRI